MPPTYLLARDHLQRAMVIIQGTDQRSTQLRHIIERTISLMDEMRPPLAPVPSNIVDLNEYRAARH